MKTTSSLLSILFTLSAFATDFAICWNNEIPGAHAYQWTTPRIDDVPLIKDCYVDLGLLPVGSSSFAWFDDPVYGGSIVVTTPAGFLAFAEETGSVGVGAIQVWGLGGEFGGQIMEDSVNTGWDFGVIDFSLTTPHIVPNGTGSWPSTETYTIWAEGDTCVTPLPLLKAKVRKHRK